MKLLAHDGENTMALDVIAVARPKGVFVLADPIPDWEAVAVEDGYPLSPASTALDAFAAHPVAEPACSRAWEATVGLMVAEGNGAASSVLGNGAEANATAEKFLGSAEAGTAPHWTARGF